MNIIVYDRWRRVINEGMLDIIEVIIDGFLDDKEIFKNFLSIVYIWLI